MNDSRLLEVHNLHIGFKKGEHLHTVVHGVDFHIEPHETLALVGESGAGKSITAQSLLRLVPESLIAYPQGEILFEGRDILQLYHDDLRWNAGDGGIYCWF